ncbi:hypothetical protein [Amaricoccus sp.]|uniref:hypothetical protein n=1 Tax=Amaricoccus sp. TaxID=1872485 RepID=UPI001B4136F8|nr:hypothetical protein [Amaricoccus sp.]MBP7001406.1 transposase [Amaricoccus sp.]
MSLELKGARVTIDAMGCQTGIAEAIRRAALNVVKEMPDKASLKVRRKTLGGDDGDLFAALTQPDW